MVKTKFYVILRRGERHFRFNPCLQVGPMLMALLRAFLLQLGALSAQRPRILLSARQGGEHLRRFALLLAEVGLRLVQQVMQLFCLFFRVQEPERKERLDQKLQPLKIKKRLNLRF
jgi:hypothetical protein